MVKAKKLIIPKSIATKYAGLTGAVVGNRVVAGGASTMVAITKAMKKYPKVKEADIAVMTLPPKSGVWIL